MELIRHGEGLFRSPPAPHAPTVEVLFGGAAGGSDVGVVRVGVPVGATLPEHDHSGSDVVLVPVLGTVEITAGGEVTTVGSGDAALIRKDERVALRNPGAWPAELLVAAAPTDFVDRIRSWPESDRP
jgi:quercetin dioxygenase-like cupin family protein